MRTNGYWGLLAIVCLHAGVVCLAQPAATLVRNDDTQALATRYTAANQAERAAILKSLAAAEGKALVKNLHDLAAVPIDKGEYRRALPLAATNLEAALVFATPHELMGAYQNYGLCLDRTGDLPNAVVMFRNEYELARREGDIETQADALTRLGVTYRAQNKLAESLDCLYRSQILQFVVGNVTGVARTYLNLGSTYVAQGDFRHGADMFERCLHLSEQAHLTPGVAFALNNLGQLYMRVEDDRLAAEYLHRSLEIKRKLQNRSDVASTVQNLSLVHEHLGEPDKALEYANESLSLGRELKNMVFVGGSLVNRGLILAALKRPEDALRDLDQAIEIGRSLGDVEIICEAQSARVTNLIGRGDFDAALAAAQECVKASRETLNTSIRARGLFAEGLAHVKLKQRREAIAAFEESVNLIEASRGQVLGGAEEAERFLAARAEPFYALIGLYLEEKRYDDALAMTERIKARILLDVLQRGRVEVTKAMSAAEREREHSLDAELKSISRERLRVRLATPAATAVENRWEDAVRRQKLFEAELYRKHPDLRMQRADFSPLTKDQMLKLVPDQHTAAVEFAVLPEGVAVFVLTRAQNGPALNVFQTAIDETKLGERVEAFRKQIAQRELGYRPAAVSLFKDLLGPAAETLRGKTTIALIPDGVLWKLPFAALVSSTGQHLIEERTLFYAPSLTALWLETQRPHQAGVNGTLAMGNPLSDGAFAPLPNAETEVREIGRVYGASAKIYTGAAAREDRFKEEAGHYRVVHLATHGLLNDTNPLYSYVVLAKGASKEDGLLEAREMLNLDLKADLVILSACQTAEGRISSGEGIVGMSWALQVAGSPATVVSQWNIDSSSTTDLMLSFHRRLHPRLAEPGRLTGGAEALRQASLELMRSPQYRHPYYWSAFALVGAGY
jgi:CHAT domain-containing protein/Tfp pilus assembly protein PilF